MFQVGDIVHCISSGSEGLVGEVTSVDLSGGFLYKVRPDLCFGSLWPKHFTRHPYKGNPWNGLNENFDFYGPVRSAEEAFFISKNENVCPRCGGSAYIGFVSVECEARCAFEVSRR